MDERIKRKQTEMFETLVQRIRTGFENRGEPLRNLVFGFKSDSLLVIPLPSENKDTITGAIGVLFAALGIERFGFCMNAWMKRFPIDQSLDPEEGLRKAEAEYQNLPGRIADEPDREEIFTWGIQTSRGSEWDSLQFIHNGKFTGQIKRSGSSPNGRNLLSMLLPFGQSKFSELPPERKVGLAEALLKELNDRHAPIEIVPL